MLRLAIALLAKKPLPKRGRGAPAQRRTAKPPIRRPSSRSASPKRKETSSSLLKKSALTPAVPGPEPAVSPPTSTAEGSVALSSPNASVALPSPVNVRPPCCLATAVSTVIVPPSANAMLEGMKQILSPMVRRPNDGGVNSSSGAGEDGKEPISQMEEFYTSKKGPLFATAVIAGTNAVKQASQIIPFCHPMRIQKCSFTFRRRIVAGINRTSPLPHRIVLRKRTSPPPPPSRARGECSVLYCFCTVSTDDTRTGVEMEAMTGANVAALTLYDMLKSLPGSQEDGLGIGESFVLAKRGGKADFTKLLMSETDPPPPSREALAALLPQGQVVLEDGVDEKIPQATSSLGPTESVEEVRGGNDGVHEEEEKDKDDGKHQQHCHKEEEVEEAEEGESTSVEAAPPPAEAPKRAERIEKSVEKSMEKQPNKTETKVKLTSEKRDKTDQPSERTKGTTELMAGDTHAWWKSTPREKRLQQMHPRQRFDVNSQRTLSRVVAKKPNPKRTPPKDTNVKRGETSKSRASPASAVKKKNTTTKVSAAARTVVRRRPSVYEPPEEQSDDDKEEEEEQEQEQQEEEEETAVQVEENADEWDGDGDDEPEDEYRKEIDTGRGKQSAGGRGRKLPRRKTTSGDHYRKSVAAGAHDIEEFEDEEGEGEREEKVVGKNLPPARGGRGKQRKSSPPARHTSSGSSGSRRRSREESDSDEIAVAVNHDTWDSMTQVEAEEDQEANDARDYTEEEDEGGEEIPPPSRKKGKNPKASYPRRRSSR